MSSDRKNKGVYCIIDLETSGTREETDCILDIGAIRVGYEVDGNVVKLRTIEQYSQKVVPTCLIHPDAQQVNLYNEEAWKDAVPLPKGLHGFHLAAKQAIPVGWNVDFDLRFLRKAYKSLNWDMPFFDYRSVDVNPLLLPWRLPRGLPRIKETAEGLGIKEPDHTGLGDCLVTYDLFCAGLVLGGLKVVRDEIEFVVANPNP